MDISAKAGKKIVVSWTLPSALENPISTLLVFRDTKPISSYEQLHSLVPVATLFGNAFSFEDAVTDYRDYYYAVIALSNGNRYDIIIPTMNATVTSAHLKLPKKEAAKDANPSLKEVLYPSGTLRETPLPYIDIISEMKSKTVPLEDDVKNVSKNLSSKAQKKDAPLDYYVFEEDLILPSSRGDDYFLFDILRTSFIKKNYESAAFDLEKFLLTKRSVAVENRAHFYLGQSYYFVGRYADAVVAFLSVSDEYPSLSKKWIDSALDFMELPDK